MYLKHIVKYYKDLIRLKFNSDGNSRFGEHILQNIKRKEVRERKREQKELQRQMEVRKHCFF